MRRFLPWALLGLLVVGVVAGAAFGQIESPGATPAQLVDGVVAQTEAAGTAHLQYTDVTTSPDPSLASKSAGIGVVNFTNGNYRITELFRQNQFESINGGSPHLTVDISGQETIVIGRTVYMDQTLPSLFAGWTKSHLTHFDRQDFGLAATGAEDALAGLVGPTPVKAVRVLSQGSVDGVDATRYLVTTEPLYVCGAHGRTVYVHRFAPTTIWVDAQGRLLRARTSFYNPSITSHGPPDAAGVSQPIYVAPSTIVATLTFSQFGTPVRVAVPTVTISSASSEIISLKVKGSTTPCRG